MKDYQPAPDLLKDRVILITGASDGIGRACVKRCAAAGATIILLGRGVRALEKLYDEIEQAGGAQPAIYPLNLEAATPKDYLDLATVVDKEFGRLDGLLHCAAQFTGLTQLVHYSLERWYGALQVNLNAPFMLTQALLPLLLRSADASVVFSTDTVGEDGKAYWGGYAVAKSGVQTLMKLLASELETNTPVRVNSVYPGWVKTKLRLRAYPAADSSQWAEPDAVTGTYLYLLGPDSRGVTGQTLHAQ